MWKLYENTKIVSSVPRTMPKWELFIYQTLTEHLPGPSAVLSTLHFAHLTLTDSCEVGSIINLILQGTWVGPRAVKSQLVSDKSRDPAGLLSS